jgi:hypothetical protein
MSPARRGNDSSRVRRFARRARSTSSLASNSSPEVSCGRPGRPFVPSELALDRPEVVDAGLDFDDEQGSRTWIEGQQVDPAVRPTMVYLDLPCGLPAARDEATIYVSRAVRVYHVTLKSILHEEGRRSPKFEFKT